MNRLILWLALAAAGTSALAQDITGTILIKKKLTRHSVTESVPIYQRGVVAGPAQAVEGDPLVFEREHVVLYLEGPGPTGPGSRTITDQPRPVMQQINRQFLPDLVVVPAGATVTFPNMDPVFHNVFSLSKPKNFDLGSYDKGDSRSVTFSKPGLVFVYCHLHPNMEGTILVTPNRWYARTDADGHFRIPSVPPGQYTVVAWHKTAGFFRKTIQLEAGHNAVVDFFIPISDTSPGKPSAGAEGR